MLFQGVVFTFTGKARHALPALPRPHLHRHHGTGLGALPTRRPSAPHHALCARRLAAAAGLDASERNNAKADHQRTR